VNQLKIKKNYFAKKSLGIFNLWVIVEDFSRFAARKSKNPAQELLEYEMRVWRSERDANLWNKSRIAQVFWRTKPAAAEAAALCVIKRTNSFTPSNVMINVSSDNH